MNEHEEQKIDRLLRDWSTLERAASEPLDRLANRVKSALDANVQPDARYGPLTGPDPGARVGWRTPLVWFSLGVAASVLVAAFFASRISVRDPPITLPEPTEATRFAQIDAGQIHNRAVLFRELKEFYAGNLAWMAEVDGRVVLRVNSSNLESPSAAWPAETNEARGRPVTVRVVIVARTAEDRRWRTLWNADVIADNDQFVEVGPSDGAKHDLAVWAHMLPDGRVAVDTRLLMGADKDKAWNYSGVQRQSVPERILTRKSGGIEYRVFQTVAVLPEKVG